MRIARVFPRRTSATPNDDLAFEPALQRLGNEPTREQRGPRDEGTKKEAMT